MTRQPLLALAVFLSVFSSARAVALIKLAGGGKLRRLRLPESDAWPIHIGADPACAIVLEAAGIAAREARLDWQGGHIFLTVLSGNPASAHGKTVPAGEPTRVDFKPFEIGAYQLRLVY